MCSTTRALTNDSTQHKRISPSYVCVWSQDCVNRSFKMIVCVSVSAGRDLFSKCDVTQHDRTCDYGVNMKAVEINKWFSVSVSVWILSGRTEGSMLVRELLERQEDFRFDRPACRRRVPLKRSTTDARQEKKEEASHWLFFSFFDSCLFIDLVHGGV